MKKLLMVIPLVLLLCFTFSCQDKEAMAELEEFRAQAAVEEENEALVKRLFEESNQRNLEIWTEVCAPNFAFYQPSGSTNPISREELQEGVKNIYNVSFPDLTMSIEDIIAKQDKVIVRFNSTGTHKGEWAGIPATGKKGETSHIAIYRIQDGKIIEVRQEDDWLGTVLQLGMELKPKEVEK
jgi:steroid delta-isomerase-like uncharacterized protein